MLIAALTVFGLILVCAAICFVQITKVEGIYARMFGTDETIRTWQLKRWAFGMLVTAHLVGFSRVIYPTRYTALAYLVCMLGAFVLFVLAYKSFIKDIRTLPRKRNE